MKVHLRSVVDGKTTCGKLFQLSGQSPTYYAIARVMPRHYTTELVAAVTCKACLAKAKGGSR